jgi:hypothetical protein
MIRLSLQFDFPLYRQAVEEGTGPILRGVIGLIKERMRFLFRQPKSGKVARRRIPPHDFFTRSAPGQAPAIDTGVLDRSIDGYQFKPTEAVLVVNTRYAEYLEYGTARMAARPFAIPATDYAIDQFNARGVLSRLTR